MYTHITIYMYIYIYIYIICKVDSNKHNDTNTMMSQWPTNKKVEKVCRNMVLLADLKYISCKTLVYFHGHAFIPFSDM